MLMSINGAAWGDFPIDMTALSRTVLTFQG